MLTRVVILEQVMTRYEAYLSQGSQSSPRARSPSRQNEWFGLR